MTLVNMREMLNKASQNNYAVPAFNIDNMEIMQAVLAVAEEQSSPVILAIGQGAAKHGNLEALAAMARKIGDNSPIPVAIHLDHSSSFQQIIKCIKLGFTSVMIDGSHLSLKENIEVTKKVVEVANSVNVSVEAELGKIWGVEDDKKVEEAEDYLVNIADVEEFVSAVNIDALAIAIGNAHGFYKGEPQLNFELLSAINRLTAVPLVLHGGSGLSASLIRKAIKAGINKINIGTEVRQAFLEEVWHIDQTTTNLYDYMYQVRKGVRKIIEDKIILFGSQNRA